MNDYQTQKEQANALRKQERYAEACCLYESLWANKNEPRDLWIGWGYAQCLRKLGQSEAALKICQEVREIDSTFTQNNNLYGWCIYDIAIRSEFKDRGHFLKGATRILEITRQDEFSPYERTVFAVVERLKTPADQGAPIPYGQIIHWLNRLDPTLLSTLPEKGKDGREYASPREKWYAGQIKSLLELQRFEDCAVMCDRALGELKKLHYDYDVWFRYYRAQAFVALERHEEAILDLEYVAKRKHDWWAQEKLARALFGAGRTTDALGYAAQAAQPSRELGFRWQLFLEMGQMLETVGQPDIAAQHVLLAAQIRQEEGWNKSEPELEEAIKRLGVDANVTRSANDLHRALRPYWQSLKPRVKTSFQGKVDLIHDNGRSGIIAGSDGGRYFFGMKSVIGNKASLKPGAKVGFNLDDAIHPKTGRPEKHAIDVVVST